MTGKIIEREDGLYEDKGGIFVKIQKESDELRKYGTPAFCPGCTNLLYHTDTKWFAKRGVCADCSITYLEDRKLPPELKTREDFQNYVKEKKSLQKK